MAGLGFHSKRVHETFLSPSFSPDLNKNLKSGQKEYLPDPRPGCTARTVDPALEKIQRQEMLSFTLQQLPFLCFSLRQNKCILWKEIFDLFNPKMPIECLTDARCFVVSVFITNNMASSCHGVGGGRWRTQQMWKVICNR